MPDDDIPEVPYDTELQCGWRAWTVIGEDMLRLDIPDSECTDMKGCIRVAQRLLPTVKLIKTYANTVPDTSYARKPDGTWFSISSGTKGV